MSRFPTDENTRQTNLKTMSWRDNVEQDDAQNDERPAFGTGQLDDGESIVLTFENDGETFEGQYGESVRFDCVFNATTAGQLVDSNDNSIANDERATLLTSSKRLLAALAGVSDSLVGQKIRIEKSGEGMDVQYTAGLVE